MIFSSPQHALRNHSPHWLLGHARQMAQTPHTFPAELGLASGGLARFRVAHKTFHVCTDADLARQILITHHDRYERSFHYQAGQSIIGPGLLSTDGPVWLRRRRNAMPAFKGPCLRHVLPASQIETQAMLDRWDVEAKSIQPVDITAELQRLTLSVMGRVLLSDNVDAADAEVFGKAVRDSLRVVRQRNTSWVKWPLWVPTQSNRRLHETREILESYLGPRLAERNQNDPNPGDPQDILDALRLAIDPQQLGATAHRYLLDELKTLFVAGFETTATALAWTLHLIANHPSAADRWYGEVDRVLQGRPPQWQDLSALTWTRQIVNEALRLYPPVYNLGRVCVKADTLGSMSVEPGNVLLISVYGIHRNPDYWNQPDSFAPERFDPDREQHPHAFLPFAKGKHICIGNDFAIAEMVTVLAMLAQRFRIRPASSDPLGCLAQITLVPDRPIPLLLKRRDAPLST